ncbi:MAG: chemotaxis protein CheR [Spirochaetales bacterium]|nr:chemotaxis protein CheR [Spirochaetales bacterium]
MSDETFQALAVFITLNLGIKMPLEKKTMLQARILKRLRALHISTFEEYCELLFSKKGIRDELPHLFDVTTTNKTDFFREPGHFEFLATELLPNFCSYKPCSHEDPVVFWSAGCSTGEEPYTLAIVLEEFKLGNPWFHYVILASDISTQVLATAKKAIYREDKIEPVPYELRKKYLLKSKDNTEKLVRIIPRLRSKIRFFRLNLMEDKFILPSKVDIIFCRNVMIYFSKEIQSQLVMKFHAVLKSKGFLFTGHSETLVNLNLPFQLIIPTVYQKK